MVSTCVVAPTGRNVLTLNAPVRARPHTAVRRIPHHHQQRRRSLLQASSRLPGLNEALHNLREEEGGATIATTPAEESNDASGRAAPRTPDPAPNHDLMSSSLLRSSSSCRTYTQHELHLNHSSIEIDEDFPVRSIRFDMNVTHPSVGLVKVRTHARVHAGVHA